MPEASLQTEWAGQFARGLWRYVRSRFAFAGQNSFTDPPSQNEDEFEQLLNVMPPVQGDLDRRWGYRLWNGSVPQGAPTSLTAYPVYLWTNDPATNRNLVVDTATGQSIFDESGASLYQLTYTGAPGVRSIGSRGTLFTADRTLPKKWTSLLGNSTQNWGIDVNNVGGTSTSKSPTVAADLGAGSTTGFTGPNPATVTTTAVGAPGANGTWTFSGGIPADQISSTIGVQDDTGPATFLSASGTSTYLVAKGFGFNLPVGATITGIQLTMRRRHRNFGFGNGIVKDNLLYLTKDGTTPIGANKAYGFLDGTFTSVIYGGVGDLWGTTWTAAEINAASFGTLFSVHNITVDQTSEVIVDYEAMTVFYTASSSSSWANVNNIKLIDGAVATATASIAPSSDLRATGFGFALAPGLVPVGIQVTFTFNPIVIGQVTLAPVLVKAGAPSGTRKSAQMVAVGLTGITFGLGADDLWDTTWTAADINDANFGVQFQVYTSAGSVAVNIDAVSITVFVKSAAITIGAPSGTGVTLVSGRLYTYAFYNSTDGPHYSSIGPFTASTGPITNQSIPLSTIPISLDPQVDRKKVLATGDGGDETTLYEVTDITNATTTFTDNIPEATLLLNNQWQAVLDDGSVVGLADNDPPPGQLDFPTLHRGRVYGLVGSDLFYSKSEDELLTPTGVVAGRYEESFPGLNFFPVVNTGELGRGLLSDGSILYVGTDRRVIRLFGDGPSTFLQPQVLFDNVGILNQDVWKTIFIEGNPVGAMWLTPDYRVVGSDFNTYQDIGVSIQDVLDSVNPAAIKTAWAAYVGISIFNLYILALPTGFNTQPDTLLVFDIKGKKWYEWKTTDQLVGGLWWVAQGGTPQFVVQAASGKLYIFDPNVFQDRVNDNPVNFPVLIRTSWLALGDPTARKYLNEIEVMTGDSGMTLTVEGASTTAQFQTPNLVIQNAPLITKPLGEFAVFLAGSPTRDRFYRFTFNSSDTATDLLRSFSIQGKVLHRI